MHPIAQLTADLDRATGWEGKHWVYLQEPHEFPIMMMAHDDRIPSSVPYPLDDVVQDCFSHLWRGEVMNKYLTSSASYMMALAIHEKVGTIYISGLEMASTSEYTYQRDGMAYLVGLANGRGIDVVLMEQSGLLKAKLYSYEGGQQVDRDTIIRHLRKYDTQVSHFLVHPSLDLYRAQGAVTALDALLGHTSLEFIGRQGLERNLQKYESQHAQAVGYYNKFVTTQAEGQKWGPILMQCEGAILAYRNLIEVCDLQEPDLRIIPLTHFIELKKVQPAEPELIAQEK
jgi:hypothetical protein